MELELLHLYPFAVIGAVSGFLGGLLGVGGGVVMIPLLFFWALPALGVPPEILMRMACGTSLAIIIPAAFSSALAHTRAGNVDWRVALLMVVPGILSSFLGSYLAASIKGIVLQTLFGGLLVALGLQMFFGETDAGQAGGSSSPNHWLPLLIGSLVGAFSGFFGLGGGVVAIPLLHRLLHFPLPKVVGVSISFVLFASVAGTAGYIYNGWRHPLLPPLAFGYVHAGGWVLAAVPGVLLAVWGARLSRRLRSVFLKRSFAVLLILTGLRMLV